MWDRGRGIAPRLGDLTPRTERPFASDTERSDDGNCPSGSGGYRTLGYSDHAIESGVTVLKGFEEFLAAPVGGGAVAILIWFMSKTTCGPLKLECVHMAGHDIYSPAGLLTAGGAIGFVLAALIHLVRA